MNKWFQMTITLEFVSYFGSGCSSVGKLTVRTIRSKEKSEIK